MSKLNFLNGWAGVNSYFSRRSAQSYLGANQFAFAASGCGSSCGSDDSKPQPSACGAGDDGKQTPPASACGAGDDKEQKPSSCGSGCGTGDGK